MRARHQAIQIVELLIEVSRLMSSLAEVRQGSAQDCESVGRHSAALAEGVPRLFSRARLERIRHYVKIQDLHR
jgi:hypothetical protein